VLFWALCVKFLRDADDDPQAFRLVSILLVIASVLYIVPQIYGLESADQVDRLASVGLDWLPGALQAQSDEGINALAWPILNLSLILAALTGGGLFTRFLLGIGKEDAPVEEAAVAAQ
jgi:hypothetical protein